MQPLIPVLALGLFFIPLTEDKRAEKHQRVMEEAKSLQGTWQAISWLEDGVKEKDEVLRYVRWTFKKDILRSTKAFTVTKSDGNTSVTTVEGQGGTVKSFYRIDPTKTPKTMTTITIRPYEGIRDRSIHRLDGDTLTVCCHKESNKLPTAFSAEEGSGRILIVLKREKAVD
jgi:uncharacterized protein (TIGR03067 family)